MRVYMGRAVVVALSAVLMVVSLGCGEDGTTPGSANIMEVPRDQYPAGPFGTSEGTLIADHSFSTTENAPVSMRSWRSDASKTLLLVSTGAGWCSACREEQPKLVDLHNKYKDQGLVVTVAIFEDGNSNPATQQVAQSWKEQYSLPFDVVLDPSTAASPGGQFGAYYDASLAPMNMIVDLRSMEILKVATGSISSDYESIIMAKL